MTDTIHVAICNNPECRTMQVVEYRAKDHPQAYAKDQFVTFCNQALWDVGDCAAVECRGQLEYWGTLGRQTW
jgi:hypothetical protein